MRQSNEATRHELEEAIDSGESARGWVADTLGSDSYPGLIRKGQGSGKPDRQSSEFSQSRAQDSIFVWACLSE